MSSPSSRGGDSTMWNGPSTVDSVEAPPVRWLIVSTSIETPSTSESRMNSCRTSLHICPVRVRKSIATPHSSSVSSTSLTNACRWWTSEVMTCFSRGSGVLAKLAATTSADRSSLNSSPLARVVKGRSESGVSLRVSDMGVSSFLDRDGTAGSAGRGHECLGGLQCLQRGCAGAGEPLTDGPLPVLLGDDLHAPVAAVARAVDGGDEGGHVEDAFTGEAPGVDGVLPQRADDLLVGVVEFDDEQVLRRQDPLHLGVAGPAAVDVPGIYGQPAVPVAHGGDEVGAGLDGRQVVHRHGFQRHAGPGVAGLGGQAVEVVVEPRWVHRPAVPLGGDLDGPGPENLGGLEQQGAPLVGDPAPLVGRPPPGQELQLDVPDPRTVEDPAQLVQADGVAGDRQIRVQQTEALPADLRG